MGGGKKMQHVLISVNKGVVSLFPPPSFVSNSLRRREVLAFCAAFVQWLREWSPGKPEWAGGGAISGIECHSVSFTGVYFLFICRMRDMDTLCYCTTLIFLLFFPPLSSSLTASLAKFTEGIICFLWQCYWFSATFDKQKLKTLNFPLHFLLYLST